MTVKEFLNKIDNKEVFDEEELKDLYWGDLDAEDDDIIEEVDEIVEEKRRWSQFISKIIKINNRYFCFTADIGLTEYQDNEYDFQPEEVRPVEKVITTIEWVEVNDTNS